jgi:hypothetical protein
MGSHVSVPFERFPGVQVHPEKLTLLVDGKLLAHGTQLGKFGVWAYVPALQVLQLVVPAEPGLHFAIHEFVYGDHVRFGSVHMHPVKPVVVSDDVVPVGHG